MEKTRLQHDGLRANCYAPLAVSHDIHCHIDNEWFRGATVLRRNGTHCCRFGSDSRAPGAAADVWCPRGRAMLFVFRTLNFFALGVILLVVAFLYQKFRKLIFGGDDAAETTPLSDES